MAPTNGYSFRLWTSMRKEASMVVAELLDEESFSSDI